MLSELSTFSKVQTVGRHFGTRFAELVSYDAETWWIKVNIRMMVRNFKRSRVLYIVIVPFPRH